MTGRYAGKVWVTKQGGFGSYRAKPIVPSENMWRARSNFGETEINGCVNTTCLPPSLRKNRI